MSDAPQGPGWWRATDGRWYPPGNPPPVYGYATPAKTSSTGPVLIGCLVAAGAFALIAVVCIAAVTLLGRSASSKFSAVATPIDPPSTIVGNGHPTLPTGALPAGQTITEVTPCPAADGSSPRTTSFAQPPPMCIDPAKTYTATVGTTKGDFTITLDAKHAPLAVNNFVVLSRYHFYDGVPFHRVIPDFVVQGGDATGVPAGTGDAGYSFADELPASASAYVPGTVAMANSGPNTNGSQFYVVTAAGRLEAKYSILGQVTQGYDTTVLAISRGGSASGTPIDPASITTVIIHEGP